jgi:hypothetical protein
MIESGGVWEVWASLIYPAREMSLHGQVMLVEVAFFNDNMRTLVETQDPWASNINTPLRRTLVEGDGLMENSKTDLPLDSHHRHIEGLA